MRWLIAVVMLASSIARADDTLPWKAAAEPGDWVAYEGQRLVDGKLVPDRLVAVTVKLTFDLSTAWFRGGKDSETEWLAAAPADRPDARMLGSTVFTTSDRKVEKTTCKLDATFDCTKVTYTGVHPADSKKLIKVTVTMAERVRSTGIVEIEAKDGAATVLKLKAVGYGRGEKSEWGEPLSKALRAVPGNGSGYGRVVTVPTLRLNEITVKGELDKAIVRRYIKRSMQRLQYCYEKELLAKPKLKGDVAIKFDIDAEGKVTAATAKGFDKTVDECIGHVLKLIEFPKPKTGSVTASTKLTYDQPKKS